MVGRPDRRDPKPSYLPHDNLPWADGSRRGPPRSWVMSQTLWGIGHAVDRIKEEEMLHQRTGWSMLTVRAFVPYRREERCAADTSLGRKA
jgi:hypothetical protein